MQNGKSETTLGVPDLLKFTRQGSFSQANAGSSIDSEDEFNRVGVPGACPTCQLNKNDGKILCTHALRRSGSGKTCEELLTKLHTTLHLVSMENLVLQSELEVLRRAFNSKCEAVEILKCQAYKPSGDRPINMDAFQCALAAKDDLARVQTEMAILEGKLHANQRAWENKSKELTQLNSRLTQQLETTQLKVKELLKENIYLLCKQDRLACLGFKTPPHTVSTREPNPISCPPTGMYLSDSTAFDFSRQSRRCPITSEAFLSLLETNGQIITSCPPTPTKSITESGLASNSNEVPPTSIDLTPTPSLRTTPPTHEQEIQCDLSSFGSSLSLQSTDAIWANCSCSTSQSLCVCAVESIRLQRKLLRCSRQLYKESNRVRDMKITMEAYRIALESQFKRNRSVFKAVASLLHHLPKTTYSDAPLFASLLDDLSGVKGSLEDLTSSQSSPTSPAEMLNQILIWFYQNMNSIASHLVRGNTSPARLISVDERLSPEDSPYLDSQDFRKRRSMQSQSLHEYSSESLQSTVRFSSIRKSSRQITLGTQRQIESQHARLQNARSMIELRAEPDNRSSIDSYSPHPTLTLDHSSSDVYKKKKPSLRGTYNSGYAAKLCARARSMELLETPVGLGGTAVRLRYRSNSFILGELVSKTNELAELLLNQRLISHISRKTR